MFNIDGVFLFQHSSAVLSARNPKVKAESCGKYSTGQMGFVEGVAELTFQI